MEQIIFEGEVVEEISMVFSQAGVVSNSVSGGEPRGAPRRKSDVGLVALFSDVDKLLALLTWLSRHYFYKPVAVTPALVFMRQSMETLEFLGVST